MEENEKLEMLQTTNNAVLNPPEETIPPEAREDSRTIANREKRPGQFSRSFTSLYIDDSGVRLMTVKGRQVSRFMELPLEKGLVVDGVVTAPAIVGQKIKNMLQSHKINCDNLIVGFSGLHCLSRVITLPSIDRKLLDEAVQREAERELPISMESFYVAWQIVGSSKNELKIFLVAYIRAIIDTLVQTLGIAGIRPHVMDLAPLAITRVLDQPTAAIVDIRQAALDIVIVENGVPQLIRSLPLARDKNLDEKLSIIKEETERTIKYYSSDKPDAVTRDLLPVFVSGEVLDNMETFKYLANALNADVRPVNLRLTHLEGLSLNHSLVNTGLILKKLTLEEAAKFSRINLNVLPRVYTAKPFALARVLAIAGFVIAIGLVGMLGKQVMDENTRVASLRATFQTEETRYENNQALQNSLNSSIDSLNKQLAESKKSYDAGKTVLNSFDRQRETLNRNIDLVTGSLGLDMLLTNIRDAGDQLFVSGTAPSASAIFDYSRALTTDGGYKEVTILETTKNQDGNIDFRMVLKVKG